MDVEIQTPKKRTTKGSMLQGVEGINLWGPERNVWAGMERKDPLEGSLLGSGRKACTRAQHSASILPAGRSLSSQTWPGLSLSWEEVPSSSFSPTHRLKPQLKHKIEETSSKLSPVWGYQNLWHPVSGGPPGWWEFEEGRKIIFLSPLLKQFDFSWNIKTFITYVNNV